MNTVSNMKNSKTKNISSAKSHCADIIQFGNGLMVNIKTKKIKSPKKEKEVKKIVEEVDIEVDIEKDLQKLKEEVKSRQLEILKKISSGFCPWSLESIKKTQQEAKQSFIEVQVEEKKKTTDVHHKSRFCNYFLADVECPHKMTCSFAHNESEVKPLQCRYGEQCRNSVCYFQHPNEDVKEYCNRVLFAKKTKCTKMCNDILFTGSCSKGDCCGYAHSSTELHPRKCKFDQKCKNELCGFIHSSENNEQYLNRLGYF